MNLCREPELRSDCLALRMLQVQLACSVLPICFSDKCHGTSNPSGKAFHEQDIYSPSQNKTMTGTV